MAHMVERGSQGLAQRYIVQSGMINEGMMTLRTRDNALRSTALLAEELCPRSPDPLACLRALPADALMQPLNEHLLPHVDGELFRAPYTGDLSAAQPVR